MGSIATLYPQSPGLLPKALYIVGVTAVANTVSALLSTASTLRLYNTAKQQVNPLQCRTFAIWTLLSGIIRLYAAFHLDDVHVYRIAFLTYVLAGLHFLSEVFVFRTAGLDGAVKAPFVVAGGMGLWMWFVWGEYVGSA